MKNLQIRVSGDVQSSYFLDATKNKAKELGVNGFVRRDSNGTVFIEAEHTEGWKVDSFLVWIKSSSPGHPKETVIVHGSFRGYEEFKIEY